MRHKSSKILSTNLRKKVSFQDIEYWNNKQSPESPKGNMTIQERKMLMLSHRSHTLTNRNTSEAKTNYSSSNKRLPYQKKSFGALSGRSSFQKGKTICSSSIVKYINFDSNNEEKVEDQNSPIKISIYKQDLVNKPSLRYSAKIVFGDLDLRDKDNESDHEEIEKEEYSEDNKKTNVLFISGQPTSKSLRVFNTIDIENENENEGNIKKTLKYQIEKAIQEIKALDLETYELEKESSIIKKEIKDKKDWSNKLTTVYNELKESKAKLQNEIMQMQKKKDEVKSSIIVLIKQRLKYKTKFKESSIKPSAQV